MDSAKLDWYQTDSDVTVTLLRKGLKAEDVSVDFGSGQDVVVGVRGETGERRVRLWSDMAAGESSWRVTPSKVEVRLRKAEGGRWPTLERASASAAAEKAAHSYPTSSTRGPRNWDAIEKEAVKAEEEEKLDGDAAVNKMFQQIYRDASDETKRAMMKSYTESKGTCLSTDWSEVKKAEVECKPPDGMEFKKYEQ